MHGTCRDLGRHEEHLLDLKESILDPVRRFMGGSQKAIYDEARTYLADQGANFGYGGDDRAGAIRAVLDDPTCFKGNAIQQMKGSLDALKAEVEARIVAERKAALSEVEELREKLRALPEYSTLAEPVRPEIEAGFAGVLETIGSSSLIAVIRERVTGFKSTVFPALLGRVNEAWQAHVDGAESWSAAPIPAQRGFYREHVGEFRRRDQKICVIISDALRYEIAEELLGRIRSLDRYEAAIEPVFGSLPSYTQLGMASLLPNGDLQIADNDTATVLVDGQSSLGLENRKKILAKGRPGDRSSANTAPPMTRPRFSRESRPSRKSCASTTSIATRRA